MVDAKTGLIHTVAGDGDARRSAERRRRRSGDQRAPEHAERRRARSADRRSSTSPTCITTASAGSTRRRTSSPPSPAAARAGHSGDDGPATAAQLAGPGAASPSSNEPGGKRHDLHRRLLQRQRAGGRTRRHRPRPDRRRARGVRRADARRLRRSGPQRGWLYVADSSRGSGRAADHPAHRAEPGAAAAGDAAARKVGG